MSADLQNYISNYLFTHNYENYYNIDNFKIITVGTTSTINIQNKTTGEIDTISIPTPQLQQQIPPYSASNYRFASPSYPGYRGPINPYSYGPYYNPYGPYPVYSVYQPYSGGGIRPIADPFIG